MKRTFLKYILDIQKTVLLCQYCQTHLLIEIDAKWRASQREKTFWPWSEPITSYENWEKSWSPYPNYNLYTGSVAQTRSTHPARLFWERAEGHQQPVPYGMHCLPAETYACGDRLKSKLRGNRHWCAKRQCHELPVRPGANMSLLSSNLSTGIVLAQDAC